MDNASYDHLLFTIMTRLQHAPYKTRPTNSIRRTSFAAALDPF